MPFTIEILKELNVISRAADFAVTENGSGVWYRDSVGFLPEGDLQTLLDGMAQALFDQAENPNKLVPTTVVEGYRRYKLLGIISRALVSLDADILNAVALNTLLFNAITILNESSAVAGGAFLFNTFNNERVGLGIAGTITTLAGINALTPTQQRQLEQILRNYLNTELAGAVSARVELGL